MTKNRASTKRKAQRSALKNKARSYARRTPETLETELWLKRHNYRKIYIVTERNYKFDLF